MRGVASVFVYLVSTIGLDLVSGSPLSVGQFILPVYYLQGDLQRLRSPGLRHGRRMLHSISLPTCSMLRREAPELQLLT